MAEFGFAQAPRGLADTGADLIDRIPYQLSKDVPLSGFASSQA